MINYPQINVGDQFGKLTIVSEGEDYCYKNRIFKRWICRCDCGNKTLVRDCALKSGNTASCGCGRIEANRSRAKRVTYENDDNCVVCTLTNGVSFLIDSNDLVNVKTFGWSYNRQRDYIFMNSKHQTPLSRFLLECPPELEVDHINHNRLDNRRCNLRLATRRENSYNTRSTVNSSSLYKGVSFCKQTRKWRASIFDGDRQITVGRYAIEEEAAKAYDREAARLHGEFACLNFG